MIGMLTGEIVELAADYLLLDVNGVGYRVEHAAPFRLGLEGQRCKCYIHTHVRETEMRLFGFHTQAELSLFEVLLDVNGVGPRTAMLIVSHYSPAQILRAVRIGDAAALAVKGVGKKTLAKIMLELEGKLEKNPQFAQWAKQENLQLGTAQQEQAAAQKAPKVVAEAPSRDLELALQSLGFRAQDYQQVVANIPETGALSEQLRLALRELRPQVQ